MLDDTDDILAWAKRLATEVPNCMWNTGNGFVTSTPMQVCVWNGDGTLAANINVTNDVVVIWMGEVIDIEHELEEALDQAVGGV
jgi:hypothetical protein